MPILKTTSRPAGSIPADRAPKEKSPLKPSGGGIKKTKKSSDSPVTVTNPAKAPSSSAASSTGPISPPISGPSARPNTGSSTGSKAAKKTKTTNVMSGVRRSKKLIKAGSIPGLVPISSFGSIASALRTNLRETQLREVDSSVGAQ
ncbi:hypothetical protein LZ32DRAFT_619515 [Colletotrichum eremochloae]|nr:hypothetical protein LZ32DRAFT_619515 [Colletotrichum eremochloae]